MAATTKNSFSALHIEGDENYRVNDEISSNKVVREVVQSAIMNETSESDVSACRTQKHSKVSDSKTDLF